MKLLILDGIFAIGLFLFALWLAMVLGPWSEGPDDDDIDRQWDRAIK